MMSSGFSASTVRRISPTTGPSLIRTLNGTRSAPASSLAYSTPSPSSPGRMSADDSDMRSTSTMGAVSMTLRMINVASLSLAISTALAVATRAGVDPSVGSKMLLIAPSPPVRSYLRPYAGHVPKKSRGR
ncbi:MAG: hypothetical protein A4E31_00004 [Methanomassiliicoccales archaeon PtaU1.Bin030]|nr:MAG: hypothetical protein A4E31_00004 [Methanomassiliicoccales archaeon PtaU1.Bin030]